MGDVTNDLWSFVLRFLRRCAPDPPVFTGLFTTESPGGIRGCLPWPGVGPTYLRPIYFYMSVVDKHDNRIVVGREFSESVVLRKLGKEIRELDHEGLVIA